MILISEKTKEDLAKIVKGVLNSPALWSKTLVQTINHDTYGVAEFYQIFFAKDDVIELYASLNKPSNGEEKYKAASVEYSTINGKSYRITIPIDLELMKFVSHAFNQRSDFKNVEYLQPLLAPTLKMKGIDN